MNLSNKFFGSSPGLLPQRPPLLCTRFAPFWYSGRVCRRVFEGEIKGVLRKDCKWKRLKKTMISTTNAAFVIKFCLSVFILIELN